MARKSTGKKLRFKIFERDGFTCQYCGKKPPEVILHLDHIYPVSKGGKDEIENLLTACADCNLGKSSTELGTVPKIFTKNKEDLQERYDQLKAFYDLQRKMGRLKEDMVNDVGIHWNLLWPNDELTMRGMSSFKKFFKDFSVEEIKEAMDIASEKMTHASSGFKYTLGVLYTKRKQRDEIWQKSE